MLEPIWLATITAEAALFALLTANPRLPWFRRWMMLTVIVQIVGWALQSHGAAYALFWQYSTAGLLALLTATALESELNPLRIEFSLMVAMVSACIIPLSADPIRAVMMLQAVVSLALGLYLLSRTPVFDIAPHRSIFCLYLLCKAVCYFSADHFRYTIGNGSMLIELICVVCWIVLEITESRQSGKI
jgi:hypothetical protein